MRVRGLVFLLVAAMAGCGSDKPIECDGLTCAPNQVCKAWGDIAGRIRHTCEYDCRPDASDCPSGTQCTSLSDGPENVCR
jgi:hypothetical protein